MSNEYLKSLIDTVSGIEVKSEAEQIAKYELIEHAEQLQNNWNELKSWLKEQYKLNDLIYYNDIDIVNPKKARIEYISKREELKEILDKMQELEGNNE